MSVSTMKQKIQQAVVFTEFQLILEFFKIKLFINLVSGPEAPQNNFQIEAGQSSDKLESGVSSMCERFMSKERGAGNGCIFVSIMNAYACTHCWQGSGFNQVCCFTKITYSYLDTDHLGDQPQLKPKCWWHLQLILWY